MSNNKDQYICGFADDHHFAQDSIFICCDVFSCKTCVESSEKDEFECKHCRKILKKKDILEPNKNYLNSISSSTEGDKLYRNLDEKIEAIEKKLNYQLKSRIEELKEHKDELISKLYEFKNEFKSLIEMDNRKNAHEASKEKLTLETSEKYDNIINELDILPSNKDIQHKVNLCELNIPSLKNNNLSEKNDVIHELKNTASKKNEFIKEFGCCLANFDHIIINSIIINPCSGNACELCFNRLKDTESFCHACEKEHLICLDTENFPKRQEMKKSKLHDSIAFTCEKFNVLTELIEGNSISHEIELATKSILNAFENRVKLIISETFQCDFEKMRMDIKDIKRENIQNEADLIKAHKSLVEFQNQYNDFKKTIEQIKLVKDENIKNFIESIDFSKLKLKLDVKTEIPNEKPNDVPNDVSVQELLVDYTKISKVQNVDDQDLPDIFHRLGRIAFKDNDSLFISDYEDKSIKSIDLKEGQIKTIERDVLVKPYSICVNTIGEMYVDNLDSTKIIVLDQDMNYQDEFDSKLLKVSNIAFDRYDRRIYIADWLNNQISVFDDAKRHNGPFFTGPVDSPLFMDFDKDYVYVVSRTEYTLYDYSTLHKLRKGSNCIFRIDKKNHLKHSKIALDDWLAPAGIYLDSKGNIITTALKVDKKDTNAIYTNRYLFILNQAGEKLREIELNDVFDKLNSMFFNGYRLFISYDKSFKMIEFK